QRRRRVKQREATSGASCERFAPPTSRNMNTPDPHAPADTPADSEIAPTPSTDHSTEELELDEDASFDDEEAGLSVADIDTAVTQMREQPFPASAYPGSIRAVPVATVLSSIVAPQVAQDPGNRPRAGSEAAVDTLRLFEHVRRRKPGLHLPSLAKQGAWTEIPYYKMDSIAR